MKPNKQPQQKKKSNGHFWRNFVQCFILVLVFATGLILGSALTYKPTPEFLQIAEDFAASHKYDIDNYNCANYSREIVDIYEQKGYGVQYIKGLTGADYCEMEREDESLMVKYDLSDVKRCVKGHAWILLEIPIDPITGKIPNMGSYVRLEG